MTMASALPVHLVHYDNPHPAYTGADDEDRRIHSVHWLWQFRQ